VAPGGAARLISMSRDGPARPVPKPAAAASSIASGPGSQPVATPSSTIAEALIARPITFSRRSARATRKPPATMPAAPQSM
jgi:hypothetical protein